LDIDMLVYLSGAIIMALIPIGFLIWGLKTGQFKEDEQIKCKPLEEDEEI
jgi:cbb3-type cytochrome oxidase maturation protein